MHMACKEFDKHSRMIWTFDDMWLSASNISMRKTNLLRVKKLKIVKFENMESFDFLSSSHYYNCEIQVLLTRSSFHFYRVAVFGNKTSKQSHILYLFMRLIVQLRSLWNLVKYLSIPCRSICIFKTFYQYQYRLIGTYAYYLCKVWVYVLSKKGPLNR